MLVAGGGAGSASADGGAFLSGVGQSPSATDWSFGSANKMLVVGGSVGDDYPHAGMLAFSINSPITSFVWSFGSAFTFY